MIRAKVLKTILVFFSIVALFFTTTIANTVTAQELETPDFNTEDQLNIDPSSLSIPAKIPGLKEQFDVTIEPENPKPGDEVTITANTYGVDINTNLIVWKKNGVDALKGIGQKKFVFTLGNSGTIVKIDLAIYPGNGPVIEKSMVFTPIDVDILWQAKTYTPPFYKGKALYTPESEVTITALPNIVVNGTKVNPSDVVYKWKLNYELDDEASGFGKNSYAFTGPIILRENIIQSTVYSASQPDIQGQNNIKLNHAFPQALLYEDSPLLGVLFNKAIKNVFTLVKKESKISAFPFYFSAKNKNSGVQYKWSIDSNSLDIPESQNSVIYRRVNGAQGTSFAAVEIGNSNHILQKAVSGFALTYEIDPSAGTGK